MDNRLLAVQTILSQRRMEVNTVVAAHRQAIASIQDEIMNGSFTGWDDPQLVRLLDRIHSDVELSGAQIERTAVDGYHMLVDMMQDGISVDLVINITKLIKACISELRSLTVTVEGTRKITYPLSENLRQIGVNTYMIRRQIPSLARQDLNEELGSLLNRQSQYRRQIRVQKEALVKAQETYEAAVEEARQQKRYIHDHEDQTIYDLETRYHKLDGSLSESQAYLDKVRADLEELSFFTKDRKYDLEPEEERIEKEIQSKKKEVHQVATKLHQAKDQMQRRIEEIDARCESFEVPITEIQEQLAYLAQRQETCEDKFNRLQDELASIPLTDNQNFDSYSVLRYLGLVG